MKIKEIALKYPNIHINKIIKHRDICPICDFPNITLEIMFKFYKEGDINENFVIRVNIHNYIELQGHIEYIRGDGFIWYFDTFKKFMDEIESSLL